MSGFVILIGILNPTPKVNRSLEYKISRDGPYLSIMCNPKAKICIKLSTQLAGTNVFI